MASSSYYYGKMQDYKRQKNDAVKQKDIYVKVLAKLKRLKENLPYAKLDLIAAETSFKNGGFIDKDETFDRGKLKENYDKLGTNIDQLDTVIKNINAKITSLDNTISSCNRKYNSADANYREAKRLERAGNA